MIDLLVKWALENPSWPVAAVALIGVVMWFLTKWGDLFLRYRDSLTATSNAAASNALNIQTSVLDKMKISLDEQQVVFNSAIEAATHDFNKQIADFNGQIEALTKREEELSKVIAALTKKSDQQEAQLEELHRTNEEWKERYWKLYNEHQVAKAKLEVYEKKSEQDE